MRYSFERTWGAELLPSGEARFRLWTPKFESVTLVAAFSGEKQHMNQVEEDWSEITTNLVPPGGSYLFELPAA